jgi:uncharacterized protein (TIGR02266 family)
METGSPGATFEARSVNLSVGGVYVESERTLDPGVQVEMKVNLGDGGSPLQARGEVVWVQPRGEDTRAGMAVRFLGLDEMSSRRIARLVAAKVAESTEPPKRKVRIKLDGLPAPLRAVARDLSEQGVTLEAELPWLKLGSTVTTEVAPGRTRTGRLRWVGIDVAPGGAARLRISVDFEGATAQRAQAAGDGVSAEQLAAVDASAEMVPLARRRRAWPWVLLLLIAGAAAGGWRFLDRMVSVAPREGVELRVTDAFPDADVPPVVRRLIPKVKSTPVAVPPPVPHRRSRHG